MRSELLSNITPRKQSAFYRYFHPYFTKLPPNIAEHYIRHFTNEGDLVLDPFCGSGVVGIESVLLKRRAFCSDLSPLATFITSELLNNKIEISELGQSFLLVKEKCFDVIDKIWSYGSDQIYSRKNNFFEELKSEYWYPRGNLTHRSNFEKIEDLYDIRQMLTYAVLFDAINEVEDVSGRNTLLIAFFGAMSRANLSYMLSGSRHGSVLHNGGSSLFSIYDYRKPQNPVVVPVWDRFERRFDDIVRIKIKTVEKFDLLDESIIRGSKVVKSDILKLGSKLSKGSVDYIFTDPPYGSKIPYLELSAMWAMWMGWDITNEEKKSEIIEGGELKKSKESYVDLMSKSMVQMSNLLKDGGYLSMVYQHNDINVWSNLLESANEAGLVYKSSVVQSTSSSTVIKKKFKGDIISAPLIINFRKDQIKKKKISQISNHALKKSFETIINEIDVYSDEEVYNAITKVIFDYKLFAITDVVEAIFNEVCHDHGYDVNFAFSKHSRK